LKHNLDTERRRQQLTKNLAFFKPALDDGLESRTRQRDSLLMARQVGQLGLRNFASATSLHGISSMAAKPESRAGAQLNISLAWERFLKRGSLVIEAKREYISKVVDYVRFMRGQQAFNAGRNIGDGIRRWVSANSS